MVACQVLNQKFPSVWKSTKMLPKPSSHTPVDIITTSTGQLDSEVNKVSQPFLNNITSEN